MYALNQHLPRGTQLEFPALQCLSPHRNVFARFYSFYPPMCNCALTAHRQTISHERGGSLAIFHRNPKLRGADVLLFQIPLELSSPQMYTFLFLLKCFIFRLILQGWPRVQQRSAKFYHTIPYHTGQFHKAFWGFTNNIFPPEEFQKILLQSQV